MGSSEVLNIPVVVQCCCVRGSEKTGPAGLDCRDVSPVLTSKRSTVEGQVMAKMGSASQWLSGQTFCRVALGYWFELQLSMWVSSHAPKTCWWVNWLLNLLYACEIGSVISLMTGTNVNV